MTKEEFLIFIEELGFTKNWMSNSDGFSLATDVVGNPNQNFTFVDQLKITLDYENKIAQLSLCTNLMTDKSFGNFSLKTFGDKDDFQLEIFISFVKGAFKNPPKNIVQYMRDKKIRDIYY
jgi:hypothetical protein